MRKSKKRLQRLSWFLALTMIFVNTLSGLIKYDVSAAEEFIINEGFDEFQNVKPDGWIFEKVINVYDKAGNFGQKPPSLKLDQNGSTVITPAFALTSKAELSFWIKGNGTDGEASLVVQKLTDKWEDLTTIKSIPTSGETRKIEIESNVTQIKFIYNKTKGNVAFDDVCIKGSGAAVEVPLVSLSLPDTMDIEKGQSKVLELTYDPLNTTEKAVTWSSSDETVLEVSSDGTITAKALGEATITAVSDIHKDIKASCKITVKEQQQTDLITIKEARSKAKGQVVRIKGIVTYNDRNQTVYIQDDTDAIALSNHSNSNIKLDSAKKGAEIEVKGNMDLYNNLVQIQLSEDIIVKNPNAKLPEPKLVTIKEANTGNYQSQLIKLEKVKLNLEEKTLEKDGEKLAIYFIPSGFEFKTGDILDVVAVIGVYGTTVQIYGGSATFTKSDLGEDKVAPVIEHKAITEANIYKDLEISAKVTDDREVKSVKLFYREIGKQDYTAVDMDKQDNGLYKTVILKDKLSIKGMEYYIEASDGTNTVTEPKDKNTPLKINMNDEDTFGPEITKIQPKDGESVGENTKPTIKAEFNDPSGIDVNSIKLYVDSKDVTQESSKNSSSITYTPKTDLSKASHAVKLELSDTKGNKTTKDWKFFIGAERFKHYYGQLHAHTNISDGTGSLDEAYTWAKNNAKADYVAITDHSNWFDNDTQADINNGSASTKWTQAHVTADKYNKDGEFTAIYGYEMTWSGSTGGWGHINTYNTQGFETRSKKDVDLKKYYEILKTQPQSISQLNHPGKTFGDFADFGFYSKEADNVVNLIEVGNGEGPVRGSGYFPSYEYYTRALDKGWHLAPTNNQDNHKGKWVNANTARTVIVAEDLTRDSLYEAMRQKRVYATENENMKMNYSVNGKPMGSFLDNPTSLNFNITASDPDAGDIIKKVSIIANGGTVVASKEFDSNSISWELTLEPQYSYYYVKVEQKNKDISVTAPVWTGESSAIGISPTSLSQTLVTPGDNVEISTEVFNNESTTINNVKVEFFKNEIKEDNKIGEQIVATLESGKPQQVKINWKAEQANSYIIYARATMNLSGKEKVFTSSAKLEVMNKDEIIKVVIDGAHQNQYVTGNYAGKVSALQEMLKDNNCVTVINKDKITKELLKDAKLLILTAPQGTDDTKYNLVKSKYEDDEIQAIKEFVARGGNIILTSKADYKNGKGEYATGAQANKILEAIGSNIRMNDDEVIDKTKNGGQEFRLALDKFESKLYGLTKNIPEGQTYSFYSGCSVITKANADISKIDFLVKGHDTTETMDADNAGNNVPVEKGKVNALVAEELANGARIVVGGSTFFSDFELTGDNLNANVQITKNALDWLASAPEPELKTIKEVRDTMPKEFGKRFTIEGIITAQSEAVTPKNAFFEVIYVQDETGGLTVFGVSKTPLKLGQKVRIKGRTGQYQGDYQVQVSDETKDLEIIDENINVIAPKLMSTKDSMLKENEGWLVQIKGKVVKMEGQNLYVDDGSGVSRAYVEGYIWDGKDEATKGKWNSQIKVGDTVSVIGLASTDPEGARLRVRNTAEIVLEQNIEEKKPIEFSKKSIEIKEGEEFKLNAYIDSKDVSSELNWKSSDVTVATVENGVIKALKEGKVIITAESKDGKYEGKIEVTVTKKDAKPEPKPDQKPDQKPGQNNNTEKELVKTGSLINIYSLIFAGIMVMALGTMLIRKKQSDKTDTN